MLAFAALATVMLVGAIGVVTLRQPVHAALSLVGTLLALAVAYVQLNAGFLAAIQVIVYAGAIMVLFLFVIMLLALDGDAPPANLAWLRPAAWGAGGLAVVALLAVLLRDPLGPAAPAAIAEVFAGSGVGGVADQLFGRFVLSFHLVGVLLLTGVVAAVGLVQRKAGQAAEARARAGQAGAVPPDAPPLPGREPVEA
ncbi:MAG: NADH-quinone oxidoreductase subunit J [Trueperaceae bacterium]|nr:NADH-quinone oxidoreductase subunit J [Trueperaceae bacterium]